jgi:hypothetical protein
VTHNEVAARTRTAGEQPVAQQDEDIEFRNDKADAKPPAWRFVPKKEGSKAQQMCRGEERRHGPEGGRFHQARVAERKKPKIRGVDPPIQRRPAMLRFGNPCAMPKRALRYIPAMLTSPTRGRGNQETTTPWVEGEVAVTRSGFLKRVPLWYAEIPPEFAYFRPLSPDRHLRTLYPPWLLRHALGGKFRNILSMSLSKDWTFLSDLFDRSRSALPRQASCLLLVVKISTTRLPMG